MERDDTTRRGVDTVKNDTRDTVDEAKERVKAGGEKVKRGVEGDSMPLGERIASHAKEMGHDLKADFDKAKRDVRHESNREDDI